MTVEAWIKLDDFGAINEWEAFVAKGDGAWRLHRAYGTDKLNFAINNGIGSLNITGTTNIADGGWHHIVGVFDNDNDKLMIYVNGSLDGTSAGVTATIDNTAYKVAIGENLQNTGRYVDGKIDEVRVWDDVRTQAEIQANMYTELTGSESNLVAYYNMNGGRGTSLMDLTTNNNTGTLTNMASSSDWVSGFEKGVTISGNSGFRLMSSPVAGTIYSDLLSELWTQGMTGSDGPNSGDANVWIMDVANQTWTSLTDISTSGNSQTAGVGFMVYVFADTDYDGTDNLPVTLSVSGTENSSSASITSIADGNWALAGNPYASTIDWDLLTKSSLLATVSIWDDASSAYVSWNGSAGSLTDGLIAPYQGFWIQASGGTGSLTIETADKSGTAGTFYRILESENTGNISFNISSGSFTDKTYISFRDDGDFGLDIADGYKLLPISPTERVVGLSFVEENGLDINNLPFEGEGSVEIPFDVMKLTVDEDYNFITNEEALSMTWDLSKLPETILNLILTNNFTGEVTDLLLQNELSFFTQSKGSFLSYGTETVNIYPEVGESLFTLTIEYGALSSKSDLLPKTFTLHPVYPNPFNPSTTITFDVPLIETLDLTSLQVFDMKGRLVETLINKTMKPGSHQFQWNPINLSSGIYMIKLKSGQKIFTQKVTYIK
jgi:hypothetical protein